MANWTRRTSTTTGGLFVLATVAALAAAQLVDPVLTNKSYLGDVAAHPRQIAAGALLYLVAAAGSAGIAISLYPVLKKTHPALALGSVVFRAVEAASYALAVVSLLGVLPLGQQAGTANVADHASLQAVGDALLSMRDHATLAGAFAFTLGAGMYYFVFYRSGLVPRWLSGWGIVAVIVMVAACLLALFSDRPITGYTLLILPIAAQELVLAAWLLVKGFSRPVLGSPASSNGLTAPPSRNETARTGVGL